MRGEPMPARIVTPGPACGTTGSGVRRSVLASGPRHRPSGRPERSSDRLLDAHWKQQRHRTFALPISNARRDGRFIVSMPTSAKAASEAPAAPPRRPPRAAPSTEPVPTIAIATGLVLRAAVYLLLVRWLSHFDFGMHAVYGFALGDLGTTMLVALPRWHFGGWIECLNAALVAALFAWFCRDQGAPPTPEMRGIAMLAAMLACTLRCARHVSQRASGA
jgi:hypothetical protein